MLKNIHFLLSILILISYGCSNFSQKSKKNISKNEKNTLELAHDTINYTLLPFYTKHTSDYIFIPLQFKEHSSKSMISKWSDFDYEKSRSSKDFSYIFNILIYNVKTAEKYLLEENNPIIIHQPFFTYNERMYHKSDVVDVIPSEFLNYDSLFFYEVISFDYNKDSILSMEDPVYLYTSNAQGKNFQSISPNNQHVINWYILKSDVFMYTLKDVNKDNLLNDKDEVSLYKYNILNNSMIEVVTENDRKNINQYVQKHWK